MSALLGVAVMAAPEALGLHGTVADLLHILGPVAVTVAVIALAEVIRALRYLNITVGLVVVAVPWLLGAPVLTGLVVTTVGLAIAALSVRRGPVHERYVPGRLSPADQGRKE